MLKLTSADYRRMPWRNGGGSTTEIAIAPVSAVATGERFLYRVSIADVETDGPFSRFDGYDRHIMLVGGDGMTLDCGDHGTIELHSPYEPRSFSGDWEVRGSLVAGPVRDFNLMVDRARAAASLEVRVVSAGELLAVPDGHTCILHVIEGRLASAAAGDTLIVKDEPSLDVRPLGEARIAIARVSPIARD